MTPAGSVRVSPPSAPSLVVGTVSHTRRLPQHYQLTHRLYQWLVDVDRLPRLRWPLRLLAAFDPADHLDAGRQGGGIRGDLSRFLQTRGVTLEPGDRVLMLGQARSLGHVFNPLTVFWCLTPDDDVRAVVLEVHNTYGERHAYLLDLRTGRASAPEKSFYVSPFNDVSGRYDVRLELDTHRVLVSIGLDRDGQRVLTASTVGDVVAFSPKTLLTVSARHAVMTYRITALIRFHGIRLWLRRLPVQPRPHHDPEAVR